MKRLALILSAVAVSIALFYFAINPGKFPPQTKDASSAEQKGTDISDTEIATLAGGCFWCIESTMEKLSGVKAAISGYSGGTTENPTYYDVGTGKTGHTEAVQVYYDPNRISYEAILHRFWREIDPTDSKGQFADRGSEYRPAIFFHNEQQKETALRTKQELERSKRYKNPLTIEILPFDVFYEAEDYHQDYYKKKAFRYKVYRHGSGRDQYLQEIWGNELNQAYQAPSPF